jgi:uncharacterized cupin superfamily protein
MPAAVVNIAEATFMDLADLSRRYESVLPEERYGGRLAPLSHQLGARKLGYNVTVIAPGKRAFPFHNHRANEEVFLILEGTGELRFGEERRAIRAGDVIACPSGGPETAHQIINTGEQELKFFAVSTHIAPEVCQYPDSRKFAVLDGYGPSGFQHVGRAEQCLDYWDGE